ncbi:MAG: tetratricopeptide repeat protein [Pseudomonadales bacterium]
MFAFYPFTSVKAACNALLLLLALVLSACGQKAEQSAPNPAVSPTVQKTQASSKTQRASQPATYVGSAQCSACHEQAMEQWQTSHHALAMQLASSDTVLGDFDNHTAIHMGEGFTFTQDKEQYFVRTKNKEGELETFKIDYAFGVEPLQQYLIDVGNGAYQALSMAWDTRSAEQGGQRWYHLYPDEAMPSSDPLHWTRLHQNWNFQCADCHSTDLKKNYDAATRSYDTSYKELNVACESCHGPASTHVQWASKQRRDSNEELELSNHGFAADLASPTVQIESCARCHSRRRIIAEEFEPGKELYDHYVPALLEPGLYHADGQILEEVYVYGSFVQSKMHQAGVKCSNCHEPHSAQLRFEGNAVCTQCHQASPPDTYAGLKAKKYDSPEHHFHANGSEGAQCRQCHMPAKVYMGVDERYDHSFRIPQPLHNANIDAPDVCTDCHDDKTRSWAQEAIDTRFPAVAEHHSFGEIFYAARQGQPNQAALTSIINNNKLPSIVRASALAHMTQPNDAQSFAVAQTSLTAAHPAIRLAALRLFESLPVSQRWQVVSPLLQDNVLAVRIEAARMLADAPSQFLPPDEQQLLQTVLQEFVSSQTLNADRPDALSNLASVSAHQGDTEQAEKYYKEAMQLDPGWVPAYLNLADLYRGTGRDQEAGVLFETALQQQQGIAETHHAYGLWLSRQGRNADALRQLQQAAQVSDSWRYAYVYGIALNSSGDTNAAVLALENLHSGGQGNAEVLFALATILRDKGERESALGYALILAEQYPGDQRAAGLIQQLR